MLRNLLLLFFLATSTSITHAHGGSHEDDDHSMHAYAQVLSDIAQLTPEVLDVPSKSDAYIRVGGHTISLNGAMMQLVRGWIRVYYHELQNECGRCIAFSEYDFLKQADDQMAKTFFELKVSAPFREQFEHIAVGTADLGSRYGNFPLVGKVVAEIAETITSKFFAGAHLFCTAIDAGLVFAIRPLQTATRMYSWASIHNRSGLITLVRTGFASAAAARAFRKVHFVTAVENIDEEGLKAVDMEGPNRWWGWASEGKRSRWVKKFVERKELSLTQKKFSGGRMKRYLLIKSRKRGNAQFLRGTEPMDKILKGNVLWVLAVEENILQRSLASEANRIPAKTVNTAAEKFTAAGDEVRFGLAEEFAPDDVATQATMESILRDVEVVFSPKAPRALRYAQVQMLEAVLVGFVRTMVMENLSESRPLYGDTIRETIRYARFQFEIGGFAKYVYKWADFLRLAAVETSKDKLDAYKYESMEALTRIFKLLAETSVVPSLKTREELDAFKSRYNQQLRGLNTFTPWREKRIAYSWVPFSNPRPECRDMHLSW